MTNSQLIAMFQAAEEDPSLHEKLTAASSDPELIAIAKEAGFSVSSEEISHFRSELTDEDLGGVAGGYAGEQKVNEGTAAAIAGGKQGLDMTNYYLGKFLVY